MATIPELNDIVLEIPELPGVEVRCKSVSLGRAQQLDGLEFDKSNRTFVEEVIQSWNVTDANGDPVPVTMDAVLAMPAWVLPALRGAWNRGLLTPPKA